MCERLGTVYCIAQYPFQNPSSLAITAVEQMRISAHSNRIISQTREEWLDEYEKSGKDRDKERNQFNSNRIFTSHIPPTGNLVLRYIDHRTTRTGSVVMEFESLDGSIKAVDFSNVRIKNNRGRNYPAGKRGQFIPPKQGKFRTFWMQTVGNPPSRWCRVHKSMLSKLKNKKFVGDMTREMDGKNNPYLKLKNLRLVG